MECSGMGRKPRLRAALLWAVALAAVNASAGAEARQVDPAARDAAFKQITPPTGTGGCIFLALPADVRRGALTATLAGGAIPPAFQAAVVEATPKCSTRPYSREDGALVGAVVSALRRSAMALALAQQLGVGQKALDRAWATASAEDKAAFYAVADQYLTPGAPMTPRPLDLAPLAARSGLPAGSYKAAEGSLRVYFIHTALSERAEAVLAGSRLPPG